jgi:hypothetical protein
MQFTTYFEQTGTTTTPSVPLTTVPYVSTFNWYVLVTIAGGTISNVSVNGSTVGTTDGTYVLPPLGTITLTYTGSPTWNFVAVLTEHNALSTLPTTDTYAMYLRGTGLGAPACCMKGVQLNYDPTRDNTGDLTMQVEMDTDGFSLEWGFQLTSGLRADTAATTGASYDNAALSAYGAQAYFQLTALVGTSVDIVIQHSADNSTWATLVDFGSQSAIGAGRGQVSNTTTVNRYLRVTTTGTFTYAQFAVAIIPNPIAGAFN